MVTFTNFNGNYSIAVNWNNKIGQFFKPLFTFIVSTLLLISGKAISQSANLDQGQNGSATSRTSPVKWINGNLGPSGAHFAEGYSIPYRMRIDALVGNSSTLHHLIIEWDTKDQNGHALDYITYYDNLDNPSGSHQANFGHAKETITPTDGTTFSGSPILYQIPTPSSTGAEVSGMPGQSFTDLPTSSRTNNANATMMAIWGGTIKDMNYVHQDNQDATTASTKTSIDITFTSANGSTALIAWGGHIAAEYDWGTGRGASKVNGSPYHMRLISIDGKGGNQDRSLKATAVLVPTVGCTVTAAQTACEGSTTGLVFSYTGSASGITNYSWTLTPSTTNAVISGGATTTTASGATLSSITIVPATGTTFAVGTFTVSLTLTNLGGTGTPCTSTGTITARPTAPDVTYNAPACDEVTFSLKIASLTAGDIYTVLDAAGNAITGVSPSSPYTVTASDVTTGYFTFTNIPAGSGYQVTYKRGDCTSDATSCGSANNSCTPAAAAVKKPAQKIQNYTAIIDAPQTSVQAAPNPYNNRVRFTLQSAVSGQGTLELFNMLGQKVSTVFQGYVEAGKAQSIEYSVSGNRHANLLYVFKVGTQKSTGKLIGLQ